MALIWPLLDRLNPTVAMQRRPVSAAGRGVVRIPSLPWDDPDRPGFPNFGVVESDPRLWDVAPWQFGLCAIGVQSKRLQEFKTNPRALAISEQAREPAVVRPLSLTWLVVPPAPPPADMRKTSRIIWPLYARLFFNPDKLVRQAPANTNQRAAVHGLVYNQQKPKAAPQKATPSLPWERLGNLTVKPGVVHPVKLPARIAMLSGVTRDSTGAIIGGCAVELYETATDLPLMRVTSDASTGAFTFTVARFAPATHYLVAYKAGSPDVAGTSLNTLTAVG